MGGSPRRLGELISRHMNEVNQLRERRRQATVTLIGLLYGITAAAFAFFIGLEVVPSSRERTSPSPRAGSPSPSSSTPRSTTSNSSGTSS
jgi:hypothetical protein